MYKSISFVLVLMLLSLGTITIFHNSMAITEDDNPNHKVIYIENMAKHTFYKSQNSKNLPSNTVQAPSSLSPVQQQSTDSPLIFYGNDSSIISQAIGNSPELTEMEKQPEDLTAMEKITKLKQQWINQLP